MNRHARLEKLRLSEGIGTLEIPGRSLPGLEHEGLCHVRL